MSEAQRAIAAIAEALGIATLSPACRLKTADPLQFAFRNVYSGSAWVHGDVILRFVFSPDLIDAMR